MRPPRRAKAKVDVRYRDQEPEAAPRARQARRRGQDPARAQGQARRRPSRPPQPVRVEGAEVANRPDRQDRQARPDRRRRQASRQLRRQEGEGAGALPRPRQEAQGGRSPQPEEGREPLREALHAGPGRERRPLRLPRPGSLPAAVPERLLHQGRPRLGDRQAAEPERAVDAREHRRGPHRPDRHQPRRRLQPRQPDHDQDSRPRYAGGVRQHRLRHRGRSPRLRRPEPAGDRHRRRDGRAAADLGRARLEPDLGRPQRRRPRRDQREPRQHRPGQPDHPARPQLRLRRALHRRAPQPPQRRRPADRGADRLPRLPRRRHHRPARGRKPAAAHGVDHRHADRQGRRRPQEPLHGLGLHGRQRGERHRPRHDDPRRRVRAARRHGPRQPDDRGRLAGLDDHQGARPGRPDPARRARPAVADRPPGRGHDQRALLPRRGRLPLRRRVRARRERRRHLERQLRPRRRLPLRDPRLGPRRRRAGGAGSGRHLRSRAARHPEPS